MLDQLFSEIGVILCVLSLDFFTFFHSFLLFSLKFMNIKIRLFSISDHKIRVKCLTIALISNLIL